MVGSMERWKNNVAIITGASSGIGAAVAETLAKEGMQVAALARRKERLIELSEKVEKESGKIYPIQADVTKEEDILAAFEWVKKNLGPIHVLVNNAGISRLSSLSDGNTEDFKAILDTNVLAVAIATREAVRNMRENQVDGHIFHINSILGHKIASYPNLNLYPASKYAVTAMTESLRTELILSGSRIKVTSISPGIVDTEIFEKINSQHVLEQMKKSFVVLDSQDIADALLYALATPPHVQVNELTLRPVGQLE